MVELSPAQRRLLQSLPANVVSYYPPAKKLVAMGLAEYQDGTFEDRLCRTVAGDAMLSALEDQ